MADYTESLKYTDDDRVLDAIVDEPEEVELPIFEWFRDEQGAPPEDYDPFEDIEPYDEYDLEMEKLRDHWHEEGYDVDY